MSQIHGPAVRLGDDVNTDVHCSAKYLPGKDTAYIATVAFEKLEAGFAKRFPKGGVIVAGKNFGNNSSREQAVHVLRAMGCAAIVAPNFARQFFRNAINNGLPVVECDTTGIEPGDAVGIDLAAGKVTVASRRIARAVPALPKEILAILSAGGLHPFLKAHPNWEPA
jgi:3-isopropylmalate dehydratase small subunit